MVLHNITSSPFTGADLHEIIHRFAPNDGVIFSQDGVYAFRQAQFIKLMLQQKVTCYALQEDMLARGIKQQHDDVRVVDYAQWVALTLDYQQQICW